MLLILSNVGIVKQMSYYHAGPVSQSRMLRSHWPAAGRMMGLDYSSLQPSLVYRTVPITRSAKERAMVRVT